MKRKLFAVAALLVIIASIAACKKEDTNTFKAKISGRWQVTKVERKTYDSSGATVVSTVTTPYTTSDYMDFKNNENDEVELNLGTGNRIVGNYVIMMGSSFNISLSSKLLYCSSDNLSDTAFQFTGTVDKSSPKVTETYYLTR